MCVRAAVAWMMGPRHGCCAGGRPARLQASSFPWTAASCINILLCSPRFVGHVPCTTWQERTDKNAGVLQTKTRESSGRASIPAYLGRYLVQAIHCTELGVPWPSWSEENGDRGPAGPRRRDRAGRTNCRLAIGWHQSHTNSKLLESIDEWRSRSAGFLPARVASSHASMPRASKRAPLLFPTCSPGSCSVMVECPSRCGGFGGLGLHLSASLLLGPAF